MILLVVYVGAVAVLFLFVVMMLDVDFAEMKSGALEYAPVGALVGIILAAELIIVLAGNAFHPAAAGSGASPIPALSERSNTQALGDVLYTDYIFFFQIAGIGAAGGHDRRHRADAQASGTHQAARHQPAGRPDTGDRHRGGQGQARPGHLNAGT